MGLRAKLVIDSRVEEVARARKWLSGLARTEGFSEKDVRGLGLAVSEACVNIVEHAYRGQAGNPIELRLAINDTSLVLQILDEGERFDLQSYSPPDLSEPQESGYGVFLMRSIMDEVDYAISDEGGTVLTLTKRRTGPPPGDSLQEEGGIRGR